MFLKPVHLHFFEIVQHAKIEANLVPRVSQMRDPGNEVELKLPLFPISSILIHDALSGAAATVPHVSM